MPVAAAPVTQAAAVLAAGVGARRGLGWALRSASFRLGSPLEGQGTLGVLTTHRGAGGGVLDLLAGLLPPSYGELRVLGEDMRTERGRAAVRGRVGLARRTERTRPGIRIRGLVEHAARRTRRDRSLLAAAILDRLGLLPWAEVPLRAAPDPVARRARLAAACVHQPELLLIDGLLDDLAPQDAAALARGIADIGLDTGIVVAGTDADSLAMTGAQILTLRHGVLVSG
jgi:ABC-type multidrug transport system ATPase subunit